jgi:3-polyprenyl-4-hydroxybenzoate decarboxylase
MKIILESAGKCDWQYESELLDALRMSVWESELVVSMLAAMVFECDCGMKELYEHRELLIQEIKHAVERFNSALDGPPEIEA